MFSIGSVRGDALLNEISEITIPLFVGVRVTLRLVIDHPDDSPCDHIPKLFDQSTVLVVFTRDVQGKILTVNDTLYKTKVVR